MSVKLLVTTCLWFLLVSSFTNANEANNVNCLKTFKCQVEDPNGYLTSWDFSAKSKIPTAGFICKFSGVTCWHDDENRVLSIKLAGYGLRGVFPVGIKECIDLLGLNLSRNNFSGPLPSNLASFLPLVSVLDLSYNQFSGEIPTSLTNITFLNAIMLQNNQFTGELPSQLVSLERLRMFSVANNSLTGPVPNFDESLNIGPESFDNNLDLCGKPIDDCVDPKEEEEETIRLGEISAAVSALIFAPLGASIGWLFFINGSRKEKQGDITRHRSWIFHIGD